MVDTVRTIGELLNVLFASGQGANAITEQDVRDAVVSISLETTDLSVLPRSAAGLPVGSLWIDSTKALRVVETFIPVSIVDFDYPIAGIGGLFANPQVLGKVLIAASAKLQGAGGISIGSSVTVGGAFTGAFSNAFDLGAPVTGNEVLASARFDGSGAGSITSVASSIRRGASARLDGAGSILPTPRARLRGAATLGGAGGYVFNGQRSGGLTFAPATNMTLSNGNLRATNGFASGTTSPVTTTGSSFKTGSKWYVELSFPGGRAGAISYGIANPSFATASHLGTDQNSWGIYDNLNSTGRDLYDNVQTYATQVSPPQANSIVSLAIDCDNWKWWVRLNGGAWSTLSGGTQDPATNQGGMTIPVNLRTGGLCVALAIGNGTDFVDLSPKAGSGSGTPFSTAWSSAFRVTSNFWNYVPPTGFIAM